MDFEVPILLRFMASSLALVTEAIAIGLVAVIIVRVLSGLDRQQMLTSSRCWGYSGG
jgi:hypothetical protein